MLSLALKLWRQAMKKIFAITVICVFGAGMLYAAADLTDDDYKNIEQLRKKMVRMKREMDGFMKDIMSTYPGEQATLLQGIEQDVKVDVAENESNFVVKADLPGMEKDKITVTLEKNRILRIAGTREVMKSQTAPGMIRQERAMGAFERTIELPGDGMTDGIGASYKNGVLEVTIPKKKNAKEESVKVKVQ